MNTSRTNLILTILLNLVCSICAGVPRVDPLVDSNVGLIRGLTAPDGDYSMFLGIPYATVDPLNPFGPSIPHEGFESTFNAYDDSAVCPQIEEFNKTLVGTLDCLHLNVYVPNTASSRNRYPVLVWIHGGAFSYGFGGRFTHGPKFLVRHDVIVVTLNYRLGPYGFFCLDTPEVPGNQGIKDQLTALRWIKNNIEAFGGDSGKITLVGESAGGVAVDFHLIYTQENLFSSVIIQSGTALLPTAIVKSNPSAPMTLAEHLGFSTDNIDDALEFLKTVDPTLLMAATSETDLFLRPCVEKEFENVENLITGHPFTVDIPNARNVPILIGFNNNEHGAAYENVELDASLNPFSLVEDYFDYDSDYLATMMNNVRQFYIGDEEVSEDVKQQICNFRSDIAYLHSSYRSIKRYFDNGASSIYHYMFSYDGDRNFVKGRKNYTVSGAIHADEISYLFDTVLFDETPTAEDQLIIDRITALWTNFAKYSDPTPAMTDILPVQWPVVTRDSMYYLNIDSELSVQKRPFYERMAFWDLFYKLDKVLSRTKADN